MKTKKIFITKDVVFDESIFSLSNIQKHKTLEDMIVISFDSPISTR